MLKIRCHDIAYVVGETLFYYRVSFVCGMFTSSADKITGPAREKKPAMKKATIFLLLRSRSYALSLFVSLAEKTLSHFATIS